MGNEIKNSGTPGENKANLQSSRQGIAIVGMAARFPGCPSVDEFWRRILAGDDLLSKPDAAQLKTAGLDRDSAQHLHFVQSGTRLEDAEKLDARFFELTRREAEIMDPQQRVFLECAYEALEHAGLTGDGERVGLFAGIGMNTYLLQLLGNPEFLASAGEYQLMLGNDKDFLATRVAYKLNLRGPAVVVQTACSTSLAAVHLACQSLLNGECDSALAGGVSIMFPQVAGYTYVPGMILSPDGVCRPFDEQARGTVPGKGAGLVVLKRESDAIADGDTIYAVIAGSAWNNDGSSKVGYTAPSVEGQVEVIRKAYAAAGVTPDKISYVEAHGTGTELGDPIEVAALTEVFGERSKDSERCTLGSVKANMGHADVAAGIAGLIKATMALHHGIIPPTPHFERANPSLGLEHSPFCVSARPVDFPVGETEHWAGVSSFGIGGTNVHVCLKTAGARPLQADIEQSPLLFPISAKSKTALESSERRFLAFVEKLPGVSLASAAQTLQRGRRAYDFRRAIVAANSDELSAALRKPIKNATAGRAEAAKKIAFLFPGQGQQFTGMASALYARDHRFKSLIEEGLAVLPNDVADNLRRLICGPSSQGQDASGMMATHVAQPLLFLVEYALAIRWIEAGIVPSMLVGHSLGELTAATVSGVFSFADGMRLALERGRLMQATPRGAMLAVSLSVDDITPFLANLSGNENPSAERSDFLPDLWIATENGPKLTVLSGSPESVASAERRLSAARVATVRLRTENAFHTPQMADASTRFRQAVALVERHAPRYPWLSNVTGTLITLEEAVSPEYWSAQITARVRFNDNAKILARDGYFLLESGPGDALITLVRQQDRASFGASTLGAAHRRGDDLLTFTEAAARLWEHGFNLRWDQLPSAGNQTNPKIALPTYPFERETYWVEVTKPTNSSQSANSKAVVAPSLEKRSDLSSWFYAPGWQSTPLASASLSRPKAAVATWVLMDNGGEFCRSLASRLEANGAHVLRLPIGMASRERLAAFWKERRNQITIGPAGLINCWSMVGAESDPCQDWLLVLQTSQTARVRFTQIELVVDQLFDVTGEPVQSPGRAVAEGLARVIPAEFSGASVRVLDPGSVASNALQFAVDATASEISTIAAPGLTVAYRNGKRWEQIWNAVRLEALVAPVLRHQGVYVITGGTGGIGYLLAKHLLSNFEAKVALISRTALPARDRWEEWLTERGPDNAISRRMQRVQEMEGLGGKLLLISADVCDKEGMARAFATIEQDLGPVNGVVHAAGLAGGARIAGENNSSAQEVLRPKVNGSQNLAEILTGLPIDFLLFCSSISSILPVAGASSYAAANAFQDSFATWCRQQLAMPALAVNFDAWQDFGMAAELIPGEAAVSIKKERMRRAMSPAEGIAVIERALSFGGSPFGGSRILISTVDLQTLLRVSYEVGNETELKQTPSIAPRLSEGDEAHHSISTETQSVIEIWKDLLGADTVEADDNFFEMGGHSLLGTMVLARIRERFHVELTIRAIFEAPTPESLGQRIRESAHSETEPTLISVAGEREEFEI